MQFIKVEVRSGIRGGKSVISLPAEVTTYKNGNRRATVPAGKRGGKVVVYCQSRGKVFRPKQAKKTAAKV
jgi:hypothetical protein